MEQDELIERLKRSLARERQARQDAERLIRSESLPGVNFRDPTEVLAGLNRAFPMSDHSGRFFTIWYGAYDRSTRLLHYAAAGHPAALLETRDEFRELGETNFMIGVVAGVEFRSASVGCPPGSRLTVFSDGTYEIMRADGEWGTMQGFLERLRSMEPDEPLETLVKEAREAAGRADLDDDFSLMQVRFGR